MIQGKLFLHLTFLFIFFDTALSIFWATVLLERWERCGITGTSFETDFSVSALGLERACQAAATSAAVSMSVSEPSDWQQMETDRLCRFPFGALDAPLPLTLLLLGACASLCFIMSICEYFHFL